MVDGRMELFVRIDPLPVEIHQVQVAAIVSNDDSVGVEHRHDLKDEVLS